MLFSITFVPAAVAIFVTGKVSEHENMFMRVAKRIYLPCSASRSTIGSRSPSLAAVIVVASGIAAARMGGEFIPSLDEGDVALASIRILGTSLTQSLDLQKALEKRMKQIPR